MYNIINNRRHYTKYYVVHEYDVVYDTEDMTIVNISKNSGLGGCLWHFKLLKVAIYY